MSDYYRINYLNFMEPHRILGTNAVVTSLDIYEITELKN